MRARDQLGGGKAQSGNIAEAFHQPPACLAVVFFYNERKTYGFQSFEIAPDRARVLGIIVRNVVDKLLEASTR